MVQKEGFCAPSVKSLRSLSEHWVCTLDDLTTGSSAALKAYNGLPSDRPVRAHRCSPRTRNIVMIAKELKPKSRLR